MARSARIIAVAVLTAAVASTSLVGCSDDDPPQVEAPNRPAAERSEPPPIENPAERTGAIYAALVEHLASLDVEPEAEKSQRYGHIYVLDAAQTGIVKRRSGPPVPLSTAARSAIREAVAGRVPLTFVADRDEATEPGGRGPRNAGVFITLGLIEETATSSDVVRGPVSVQAQAICGGLCGQATTFVLEQAGSGWKVTDTTGVMIKY